MTLVGEGSGFMIEETKKPTVELGQGKLASGWALGLETCKAAVARSTLGKIPCMCPYISTT